MSDNHILKELIEDYQEKKKNLESAHQKALKEKQESYEALKKYCEDRKINIGKLLQSL